MSTDDNPDESDGFFGKWLQRLFSGDFFKQLLSFLGFGGGQADADSSRNVNIEPYISYDDIRNGNTSNQLKASPLEKARKAFEDLKDGTFHYSTGKVTTNFASGIITQNLEKGPEVVHEWLERAGVDASALDPTGRKSAAEMEAQIRDAPGLGHIARARRYFDAIIAHGDYLPGVGQGLGGPPDDPAEIARLMTDELGKANQIALANGQKPVDLSALDPTATRSSAQMEQEVHRRIAEGYIINARKEFYFLRNASHNGHNLHESDDNKTQKWLDKANQAAKEYGFKPVDASVLDPLLKESATEVNRDILKAIESKHFEKASLVLYWSQHGGYGDPNTAAEHLQEELAAANKAASALGDKSLDVSALDPVAAHYRDAQFEKDVGAFAAGNTQARLERRIRDDAAADRVALQNEPALAGLIRPMVTPAPPMTQPTRQK